MDCEITRTAISASLDGQDAGVPADVMRAHLDGCAACRDWRERQPALTRRARLSGHVLDHDPTARVLGALRGSAATRDDAA
jgi:predicted anti-sigma-YlaC factor YlaD